MIRPTSGDRVPLILYELYFVGPIGTYRPTLYVCRGVDPAGVPGSGPPGSGQWWGPRFSLGDFVPKSPTGAPPLDPVRPHTAIPPPTNVTPHF